MSLNKYNASTGELENISSGQRTWVGTKDAYNKAKAAGNLPLNALICVTDDEDDTLADAVTEGDVRAITSGAVYDAIVNQAKCLVGTLQNGESVTIQFKKGGNPYILSMSGTLAGAHRLWTGIGYGSTSTRHDMTTLIDGSKGFNFTAEPGDDGYSIKISTTFGNSDTKFCVISSCDMTIL